MAISSFTAAIRAKEWKAPVWLTMSPRLPGPTCAFFVRLPPADYPGPIAKLEIVHGQIKTAAIAPAGYRHVLMNFSVVNIVQLRAAIATADGDGTDDTITLTGDITAGSSRRYGSEPRYQSYLCGHQ